MLKHKMARIGQNKQTKKEDKKKDMQHEVSSQKANKPIIFCLLKWDHQWSFSPDARRASNISWARACN